MLNYIWAFLLIIGLLVAGLTGRLSGDASVMNAAFDAARSAVMSIALPLTGMMMFWLGALRLLEKGGVLDALVKALSPLLRRLFPEVPPGHPAMGSMVMNLSANMLGLGNSATPLGLKAMGQLQELNPHKQSASNSMVTFLALNTAGFALIPMTAIIYLNTAGLSGSSRIIVPTLLATACTTLTAILASRLFQGLPRFAPAPDVAEESAGGNGKPAAVPRITRRARACLILVTVAFVGVAALELGPPVWRARTLDAIGLAPVLAKTELRAKEAKEIYASRQQEAAKTTPTQTNEQSPWIRIMDGISGLAIPAVLLAAVGLALARRVKVYEEFVEGAKEGFQVAVRIMPFLVAMLAVLAILRTSGAFALLEYTLGPALAAVGFPVELLPLALMRPLSGSGSTGILVEILTRPDISEQVKYTAAIMFGSTETTFYVLTVYFGSVGIRSIRHALLAGLSADLVGMVAAVVIGKLAF